jgi:hypothetical protein
MHPDGHPIDRGLRHADLPISRVVLMGEDRPPRAI